MCLVEEEEEKGFEVAEFCIQTINFLVAPLQCLMTQPPNVFFTHSEGQTPSSFCSFFFVFVLVFVLFSYLQSFPFGSVVLQQDPASSAPKGSL